MADKKPSSGDVLRALAEEARERDPHPDRRSVLDAFLDDGDNQSEQAPGQDPAEQKGRK